MGDPVWLDTGVLDNALKGDAAINRQLAGYRGAGRPLLVVPAVVDGLPNGNAVKRTSAPVQQFRQWVQHGMARLGVQIDPHASTFPANTRGADLHSSGAGNDSPSDRRVLNQIMASARARGIAAPEMITAETANNSILSHASWWGIKAVPAASPAPGSVPALPCVNLGEEYPAEKEGPISRFFKDRPVLEKLGLIGAGIEARSIKETILADVSAHFRAALHEARKEFESKYPDPGQLEARVDLERYKQAYLAASSKLTAPAGAGIAETTTPALTPDRGIARTKKYADDQSSKVLSAADGTRSGYVKATEAYIDAMLALRVQLNAYRALGDIAADIRKRGAVLDSAGRDLEETYRKYVVTRGIRPVACPQWMAVDFAAKEFQTLGGRMLSFTSHILVIYQISLSIQKHLDEELIKVSEALAQVAP